MHKHAVTQGEASNTRVMRQLLKYNNLDNL